MDVQNFPPFYRTSSPVWAAALQLEFKQLLQIDNGYFSGGESSYPSVNGDFGDFLLVLDRYDAMVGADWEVKWACLEFKHKVKPKKTTFQGKQMLG